MKIHADTGSLIEDRQAADLVVETSVLYGDPNLQAEGFKQIKVSLR